MFNRKGQIRTLEAILATGVVFSALLISTNFSSVNNTNDQGVLATLGMNVLIKLDNDGGLGRLIDQRNWTALGGSLKILLPLGVSFNLTVYDDSMRLLNNLPISNGGLAGCKIVSVQYTCASQSAKCGFYVLRLQLAWVR